MKVSARYADPALAGELLPEQVRQWVDTVNERQGVGPLPNLYDGGRKLIIEIQGVAASAPQHWA